MAAMTNNDPPEHRLSPTRALTTDRYVFHAVV
jgi:hypothetical protein